MNRYEQLARDALTLLTLTPRQREALIGSISSAIQRAVEEEREACAAICDAAAGNCNKVDIYDGIISCAQAIRER